VMYEVNEEMKVGWRQAYTSDCMILCVRPLRTGVIWKSDEGLGEDVEESEGFSVGGVSGRVGSRDGQGELIGVRRPSEVAKLGLIGLGNGRVGIRLTGRGAFKVRREGT
jgi:hypothetical protein